MSPSLFISPLNVFHTETINLLFSMTILTFIIFLSKHFSTASIALFNKFDNNNIMSVSFIVIPDKLLILHINDAPAFFAS